MSLSPLGTPAVPACPQLFDLERRRQERVAQLATLIQKTFRGWRCRTQYQLMRKSQILISAWFRGHRVRRGVPAHSSLPRQDPPSSPHLSPLQQKNKYEQMKRSALLIQAYARGWKVRAGHGGGSGDTACPVVGPDSSPLPVSRPSLPPLSLPLALCVCRCLLPGLPPVPPAPPGAETPAPPSRSRRHHRRALERVPGNGATRPACCLSCCPSVCPSVCLPACPPCRAAAAVLSTGGNWNRREGCVSHGGWQWEGGEVLCPHCPHHPHR